MKNYHITYKDDGRCRLIGENAKRAVAVFDNQKEAIKYAAQLHGNHSVKIHGRDGKIREERTYPRSADPYPPRG
jgi:hypothetical protein